MQKGIYWREFHALNSHRDTELPQLLQVCVSIYFLFNLFFFFLVFPLLLVIFIVSFICCYDFLLHIESAQWFLPVYTYMTQFKKEISGSKSSGQFLIQNALYYGSFMFCASLLCCFVKLNTGSLLFFYFKLFYVISNSDLLIMTNLRVHVI